MRGDRGPNARWPLSNGAWLAMAPLSLLLLFGGKVAAQPDDGEGEPGASASVLPDAEPDPDAPRPLAFKPLAAKPPTAADLPPSNPLFGGRLARMASGAFSRDW